MWFPLLPWGSNTASSKPANFRSESILSSTQLSLPWWSRGISSRCRIMIFFHVRTFTLWNGEKVFIKKKKIKNNKENMGLLLSQHLKTNLFKIPGPELLAGGPMTFHAHDTRLPRHTKSWQSQLLRPLQNVLPFYLVVDMVTVNPQSAKHFPWLWRGRLLLGCW